MSPVGDPPPVTREAWHALPVHEVLAATGSAPAGLPAGEAERRLAADGPNVLSQGKRVGALELLWRQFLNPLFYVLIGSGVLAVVMGKVVDGMVVLGVVVLNAIIGFVQEYRAGRAIESLSALVPENVAVMRDGVAGMIPSAAIVRGDVVMLQPGDRVAADMRLLDARSLRVSEASLTGESVPAEKNVAPVPAESPLGDRISMVYGGTLVAAGTANAVVVATGEQTELGRISDLLGEAHEPETPLNRALARVGRAVTWAVIVVAAAIFGIAMLRGYPAGDAVLVAISLAVAAIPEGLPTVVTIALAIGVRRMAQRRAIMRSLPAVETLGSTTVICTDKTGTLTRNEMTVQSLWTPTGSYGVSGSGYAPHGEITRDGERVDAVPPELEPLALAGLLCNDAEVREEEGEWRLTGDPTEGALVACSWKLGFEPAATRARYPRLDVIPFDSDRPVMATLHDAPEGGRVIYVKGAPEAVLPRCAEAATAEVETRAAQGARMLALAERRVDASRDSLDPADLDAGLTLLGLTALMDPPRDEAISAVAACHRAGIAVKMITGDHAATARAIGEQVGLCTDGAVLTGAEIAEMDPAGLAESVRRVNVFARVAPEHKLRLVRALQDSGEVTAMTGDGVNDAPALRQADIGISMGIAGTAAAREASDIVLADDNFATVVAAVEEGRRVFDNLRKALAFLVPTNGGQVLLVLLPVLFFPVVAGRPLLPVAPVQILWINLIVAVGLALPLALEEGEPDSMRRPPRARDEPLLGRALMIRSALAAAVVALGGIGMFLLESGEGVRQAQTAAVTTAILIQCFYLLECRSLTRSLFVMRPFSNPWIYAGIGGVVLAQAAFVHLPLFNRLFASAPLPLGVWMRSIVVALMVIPVVEAHKLLGSHRGTEGRR
ncbi:MAG TPA: HAD-IC family P-type ATPase [Longimicrobium sp.]